jgi:hypothetical protein
MSLDNENNNGNCFDKICPNCCVGNPDDADNCIMCDKDLEETLLYFEDEFYDIEVTNDLFIVYKKNFYKTRRTGKILRFDIDKMEKIHFGYPITRFTFSYNGKKEIYALKAENYRALKYLMIEIGKLKQ